MSRLSISVKKILVPFLIFITVVEFSFSTFYSYQEKKFITAVDLYKKYDLAYSIDQGDCAWAEKTGLHPYLLVTYPTKEKCQDPMRNSFGFRGAPFPDGYDSRFYTILLIGGSVTEQIAIHNNLTEKHNYLENRLQQSWISPTGKPFKVISAASAGSTQPSNAIQALLFSNLADSIVDLEGFNEFVKFGLSHRIESPIGYWMESIYQLDHPIRFYLLNSLSTWNRNSNSQNPFRYSYGLFAISHFITGQLKPHFENAKRQLDPFPPYPEHWSQEYRNQDYLLNQNRYIIQTNALAQALNKKYTLFIQPVPLLFKKLTEGELKVVRNIAFTENYGVIRDNLLTLSKNNIAVEDLTHVFENESSTLYIDHIHTNERGVEILSDQIAERLAKRYGWKTR